MLATSEVIPSRALTTLEGEGRELSHLEVVARGVVVAPASQLGVYIEAKRLFRAFG